jgi:electron transport complex protein RnfB
VIKLKVRKRRDMMSEDVYERLREFMDTLPAGYPTTPTGVEIKILKKLFSPEEAELTMKLKNEPEEISVIKARVGMDVAELAPKLEEMAQKGLIFRVRKGKKELYQAFQFVVGIYEFQLKNLDKEFCEMFEEYLPYLGRSFRSFKTSQMRVIPVESAVETTFGVETYNIG